MVPPTREVMRLRSWLTMSLVIGVAASIGCTRRAPIDIMTMTPECDTVPPAGAGPGRRAANPPTIVARDARGAIVGTAVEAGTGRPLWGGDATLRTSTSHDPLYRAAIDTLGGFALSGVLPGTYTLRLRAMLHQYDDRRIDVRAGAVDTVRVELQYQVCHGY